MLLGQLIPEQAQKDQPHHRPDQRAQADVRRRVGTGGRRPCGCGYSSTVQSRRENAVEEELPQFVVDQGLGQDSP
jgi:hypothetical protein